MPSNLGNCLLPVWLPEGKQSGEIWERCLLSWKYGLGRNRLHFVTSQFATTCWTSRSCTSKWLIWFGSWPLLKAKCPGEPWKTLVIHQLMSYEYLMILDGKKHGFPMISPRVSLKQTPNRQRTTWCQIDVLHGMRGKNSMSLGPTRRHRPNRPWGEPTLHSSPHVMLHQGPERCRFYMFLPSPIGGSSWVNYGPLAMGCF